MVLGELSRLNSNLALHALLSLKLQHISVASQRQKHVEIQWFNAINKLPPLHCQLS